MENTQNAYQFILELNKLKLVFRNTLTNKERSESTAEHSWSAAMIIVVLMSELKKEFTAIDELKAVKLALIHDIVEIYAGDVIAFDAQARKDKHAVELDALEKLMQLNPIFGEQLHALWHEFENKSSIEAKIAKAADAICPVFVRLHSKQSYIPAAISLEKFDKTKAPSFEFSKTFSALYQQLKLDLQANDLIG